MFHAGDLRDVQERTTRRSTRLYTMKSSRKLVDDFQDKEATALASFRKRRKRIAQALRQDKRIAPATVKRILSALECVSTIPSRVSFLILL